MAAPGIIGPDSSSVSLWEQSCVFSTAQQKVVAAGQSSAPLLTTASPTGGTTPMPPLSNLKDSWKPLDWIHALYIKYLQKVQLC